MRLKPTDQSFSVSEIHFDSPDPSERMLEVSPERLDQQPQPLPIS